MSIVSDVFFKLKEIRKVLEIALMCTINDSFFIVKENFKEEDKNLFARNIMEMDTLKFFDQINGKHPQLFQYAMVSQEKV